MSFDQYHLVQPTAPYVGEVSSTIRGLRAARTYNALMIGSRDATAGEG
ncbi:hypothetical protein ACFXG4_41265 [Nocardia sp. NPDC059246]